MKININNTIKAAGGSLLLVAIMASCTRHPDSAGYEYMPDMYRSAAVEAYVDYGMVEGIENPELTVIQSVKTPPAGTIPFNADPMEAKINMPYNYDAIKGYEAAGASL